MDRVIEVEHLRKSYGEVVAVADVSFSVRRGEIFGLLGPNGAGKSTTVECLEGLRVPDGGRLCVLGLDPVRERRQLSRRIGCQLQESALPDRIRVREALDLFASYSPRSADWRILMREWGLAEKAGSRFAALSGGQRQRLLVALALVNDPEIVFLDEMTTGLDPSARRVAWNLIRAIRERGTTVILVTHFMDEAEHLCDRLAVVHGGRVVAEGSPGELIERHAGGRVLHFSLAETDLGWIEALPEVDEVTRVGEEVVVRGRGAVVVRVGAALAARDHYPIDLRVEQPNLEDAFLALLEQEEGSPR